MKKILSCLLMTLLLLLVTGCDIYEINPDADLNPEGEVTPEGNVPDEEDEEEESTPTNSESERSKSIFNDQYTVVTSYECDGLYFYYINVGTVTNVPVYSGAAIEFNNNMDYTYSHSMKNTTISQVRTMYREEIAYVSKYTSENTISSTVGTTLGAEFTLGIPLGTDKTNLKISGEQKWEETVSKTEGFESELTENKTTEEENLFSTIIEKEITQTWNLSDKTPSGFYRYSMFCNVNLNLYLVVDPVTTEHSFTFEERIIENSLVEKFDYSKDGSWSYYDGGENVLEVEKLAGLKRPTHIITEEKEEVGTVNNPILITQASDLSKLNNSDKYFKVENDIDFTGVSGDYESIVFNGYLDGNDKTFKNITAQNYASQSSLGSGNKVILGLININNGVIADLNLDQVNCSFSYDTGIGNLMYGVLCGENNGTISNVKVTNLSASVLRYYSFTGIVGNNKGELSNIQVENCSFLGRGSLGGISGSNAGTITSSSVKSSTFRIHMTVSIKRNGVVGGIVADNSKTITNCSITNSSFNLSADFSNMKDYAYYPTYGSLIGIQGSNASLSSWTVSGCTYNASVVMKSNNWFTGYDRTTYFFANNNQTIGKYGTSSIL